MPQNIEHFDAIIIGAGAAGLMCAAVAGQRGRRVLLIDNADKPGKKILISGGGRCNFTNTGTLADRFLSNNRHFAKSALGRYRPQHFIDLVDRYGIAWHEKTLGQLFCDGSARQIVAMLLEECPKDYVSIQLGQDVDSVEKIDGQYRVKVGEQTVTSPSLVIATGGPSIPKMGASDFAYRLAKQFGLNVVETRPGLVPFTLGDKDRAFKALSGVSTDVIVTFEKRRFREAALFTHKGLSGPAMLQISSYWRYGQAIGLNFLPDAAHGWLLAAKAAKPRASLRTLLARSLPDRLAYVLVEQLGITGELGHMSKQTIDQTQQRLVNWSFTPSGTEGFAKAEVTVGGIDTRELSSKSMEAKKQPGFYAIGEAVDVTGWLGGYNFQWAWASGVAAGQCI